MAKEKKESTKGKASRGKGKQTTGKKHTQGNSKKSTSPGHQTPTKKQVKKYLARLEENLPSHDVAFIDVGCGVYSIDASATVITYTADPGNRATPRPLTGDEHRLLMARALGKLEKQSRGK